jgi:hypothetical protein
MFASASHPPSLHASWSAFMAAFALSAFGCGATSLVRDPVVELPPVGDPSADARNASPSPAAAPNGGWPRFETRPRQDVPTQSGSLWTVVASGQRRLLFDLETTGDPLLRETPGLNTDVILDYLAEDAGLMDVDVLMSGFDLNQDGSMDCLIAVSGGGNACDFMGKYFVLFGESDGRARATRGFAECATYQKFVHATDGALELFFASHDRLTSSDREVFVTVSPNGSVIDRPPR